MSPNAFEREAYYDQLYASRTSLVVQTALELLKDGAWHNFDEVVRKVMPKVPPGQALRFAERQRINQIINRTRQKMEPAEFEKWLADPENLKRRRHREENDLLRRGQRGVAVQLLGNVQRVETTMMDGIRFIRRVPLHAKFLESEVNKVRNGEQARLSYRAGGAAAWRRRG